MSYIDPWPKANQGVLTLVLRCGAEDKAKGRNRTDTKTKTAAAERHCTIEAFRFTSANKRMAVPGFISDGLKPDQIQLKKKL